MPALLFLTLLSLFGFNNDISKTSLTLRDKDYNDLEFKFNNGEWIISTQGFDPFLFLDSKKPIDIKKHYILSFESFNTTESLPLVIFVGDLDGNHLIEGYALPRTEGWTTNSYDISETIEPPTDPFTSIRIRFGTSGGKTIRIRNISLREPTAKDRELAANKVKKAIDDKDLSDRLKDYFEKDFTANISSVATTFSGGEINIEGVISKGIDMTSVGLAEIPMWEDATNLKNPLTFIPLTKYEFECILDREICDKRDRLLSGWAVVRKDGASYQLLSPMHYVDGIEPRSKLDKFVPRTLKGIGGCPFDHPDMEELDIASATFNILLDRILYADYDEGREPYEYAGKTWFVDIQKGVKEVDYQVRIAQEKKWMVSAILLIPVEKDGDKTSWLGTVSHPEAEASAAFSMPNFTTREGAEAYAATINFLAERYSSEKYGRIHHWIIHNEIQNGFYWTSAGRKTVETYMNMYQKSMRIVHTLARQYDENAKTLISLDHDWNRVGDPRGYKGKEQLELLVDFSKKEGDFEWGIAFHPYAQDINNPRIWEDDLALFSYDTPYLTFRNLEVLDAWASQDRVLYKGQGREIQFTEQGLNSPDYSEKSLADQAAGMAYTWKKIENMKNVTAFQYHLWADAYEEGGLRLGLRKYYNAEGDPYGKKPIWNLFKAYETPEWKEVSDPYKKIIGVNDWDEILYKGHIE